MMRMQNLIRLQTVFQRRKTRCGTKNLQLHPLMLGKIVDSAVALIKFSQKHRLTSNCSMRGGGGGGNGTH